MVVGGGVRRRRRGLDERSSTPSRIHFFFTLPVHVVPVSVIVLVLVLVPIGCSPPPAVVGTDRRVPMYIYIVCTPNDNQGSSFNYAACIFIISFHLDQTNPVSDKRSRIQQLDSFYRLTFRANLKRSNNYKESTIQLKPIMIDLKCCIVKKKKKGKKKRYIIENVNESYENE